MFSRAGGLTFAAFDLVWLDGQLTALPYERRRAELEALEFGGPGWCAVSRWDAKDAVELFRACDELGLEGIVVKRGRSTYRPGVRSNDWCTMCRQSLACHRRRVRVSIRV
jgi:bifunctional non-homologous end joining protein LigD